jgi:ATP-dependent helicase HrpA
VARGNGKGLRLSFVRIEYPPDLPISARKDEIVRALREHSVLVLAGETGSGKTTQIPKMCLEALASLPNLNPNLNSNLPPLIGCTQPRRVAALSIARRLAQELGVQYGQEVGSKIRFNDVTSRATQIKVMTDGILLAEMQGDPELRQYNCIIIDEAHERSLNIDFLLGHLKLLLPRRPELKLVITSATIETEAFSRAFGNAPIIEVSGRMYPVETLYRPFDHLAEELGEITYIDAAAHAVEEVVGAHPPGDMLIFMPTEKDIRETRDQLQAHYGRTHEIVPLFGRLSSGEQEKVFAPGPQPRIVIATNIAETSLTIPRIRYVIDSGLARVSRYSPRSRTKRLPIEPISQSSANQRKGRCGRLAEGVCLRLYSEEEFAARPLYTQPEIQRSNLAEVILRMKAFHLRDVETFPFLNPPQPTAIRAGYQLLIELGALDEQQNLTPLGWDLARLPVDPAIGRMIVQAVRERALSEVLVIAAGLSVQDPRERPADAKEAAEQAHRRFTVPDSDFLTLLSIWNTYHDEFERLKTQGQVRRFCREHFLSYMRMREWVDVHAQLEEALESVDFTSIGETITTIKAPPPTDPNRTMDAALYAAIHRSILAGLLTHVAQRREKNIYCATGDREVMVFPGSNLFDRNISKQGRPEPRAPQPRPAAPEKTFQPRWIVAGEIVETSRLFARTAARIDPAWAVELGVHVCKFVYQAPHWNAAQGRVLVTEKVLLGGLELLQRLVPFGTVNPREATDIFIRAALVEEPIAAPHPFLKKNQALREKIETWQTRLRSAALPNVDEALYRFYAKRIQNVSSVPDLNRFVKEQGVGDPNFLCITEADLIGQRDLRLNESSFPESLEIEGHAVPLQYAYAPGEDQDGVTAQVPVTLVQHLRPGLLEWAVPGWREEQVRTLLKALPKSLRVPLMPLEPKVEEITRELKPGSESLLDALSEFIRSRYKVPVAPQSWPADALPVHLKPRVQVIGPGEKPLATTRDLNAVRTQLREAEKKVESNAWDLAAQKFERYHLQSWDFGDLPDRIEIRSSSGIPLFAFPGLQVESGDVSLRLFRNRDEALASSRKGAMRLAELTLARDLAWVQKDLRALNAVKDLYITLGPAEELFETAYLAVRNQLLDADISYPLTQVEFERRVASARARLPEAVPKLVSLVTNILRLRQEILLSKKKYPEMDRDLVALVPPRFLETTSPRRLQDLLRYLKALTVRGERWSVNPVKDLEKSRQILPFVQRKIALSARKDLTREQAAAAQELRWLIEELKVSLYAQELGTSVPISPKRLEKFIEENRL